MLILNWQVIERAEVTSTTLSISQKKWAQKNQHLAGGSSFQ
jgi:hypothetical protein